MDPRDASGADRPAQDDWRVVPAGDLFVLARDLSLLPPWKRSETTGLQTIRWFDHFPTHEEVLAALAMVEMNGSSVD